MKRKRFEKKNQMKKIHGSFIHQQATVTGMIEMGKNCSIWPGAVLRADTNTITLGRGINIQDNCTLHIDSAYQTTIGDYTLVGHNAMIHGSKIGRGCLIGISSVILDGAEIGDGAMITAGCIIRGGKKIPPRALVIQKGNELKIYENKANPVITVAGSLEYIMLAKRMAKNKFSPLAEDKIREFHSRASRLVEEMAI